MAEIPGINELSAQRPSYVNQANDSAKVLNLSEKGVELTKEVAGLLGTERSVRVSNVSTTSSTGEVGTSTGATGVPALDNPDDAKAKQADLEKLIAYLTIENEKQQAELARTRIETQKDSLEAQHKEQMEKIQESLKAMDSAATSNTVSKVFGWLAAIVSVVAAVAVSVASGGLAVGPAVAAAIAVTSAIVNQVGADALVEALGDFADTIGLTAAMKAIINGGAELINSLFGTSLDGISDTTAKTFAAGLLQLAITAAMMGVGVLSGNVGVIGSGVKAAASTLQLVQTATTTMSTVSGFGNIATGIANAVTGYQSGMADADLTEAEEYLTRLQQILNESQDELEKILEQLQNGYAQIVEILSSSTDTQKQIAEQIGVMA